VKFNGNAAQCILEEYAWDLRTAQCVDMPTTQDACLALNAGLSPIWGWDDNECFYIPGRNLAKDEEKGECVPNAAGTKITCYDADGNIVRVYDVDPETGVVTKETDYDADGNKTGSIGITDNQVIPTMPNTVSVLMALRKPAIILMDGVLLTMLLFGLSKRRTARRKQN
jgi:hypothetical protein